MATLARVGARDQSFWQKLMAGIALFIVFGFAQFGARGFVNYAQVPAIIHIHAVVMLAWLALVVVQATLVQRDNLALHRNLGWLGVVLAATVTILGSYVGLWVVSIRHQPFFFTLPYFLALTQVGIACFAGLVAAAVIQRRQTEWHRRLMVGALVMIMEPALGRVLPMPLIMPWGEWVTLLVQLFVLWLVMRHDRKAIGHVHPATSVVTLVVVLSHVVIELLAILPPVAALAESLAAA